MDQASSIKPKLPPRKLVYYNRFEKLWLESDSFRLDQKTDYLYVSYGSRSFSRSRLQKIVQSFCHQNNILAYFVDFRCIEHDKNSINYKDDLKIMGDVLRSASATLVLVDDKFNPDVGTNNNIPPGWKMWKSRLWAFTEIFLSAQIFLYGTDDLTYKRVSTTFICDQVYKIDNDLEYLYFITEIHSHLKSPLIPYSDITHLILTITNARNQSIVSNKIFSGSNAYLFGDLTAKVVYVMMAYVPFDKRITPSDNYSEQQAYENFIKLNKIEKLNFSFQVVQNKVEYVQDYLKKSGFSLDTLEKRLETFYPRRLSVFDKASNSWRVESEKAEISKIQRDYLAVSYVQKDFGSHISGQAKEACRALGFHAYWLDIECGDNDDVDRDLYCISDVFRSAKCVVIFISDTKEDGNTELNASIGLSHGWTRWGKRIWTFPEAMLGEKLYYIVGNGNPKEVSLLEVVQLAYGEIKNEKDLVDAFEGKKVIEFLEHASVLIEAFYKRTGSFSEETYYAENLGTGPAPRNLNLSTTRHGYPAERVYALMGFFTRRISPRRNETEMEALERLLKLNRIDLNSIRETFFRSSNFARPVFRA